MEEIIEISIRQKLAKFGKKSARIWLKSGKIQSMLAKVGGWPKCGKMLAKRFSIFVKNTQYAQYMFNMCQRACAGIRLARPFLRPYRQQDPKMH